MRFPRLSLAQLAIGVGIAGIIFLPLLASALDALWVLVAVYLLSLIAPLSRHTLPWSPLVIAIAVVHSSAGSMQPEVVFLAQFLGMAVLALSFFSIQVIPEAGRSRFVAIWGISLACIISVLISHWPIRLAFAASRPAFEGLAQKVSAGYQLNLPERIGRFVIRKVEIRNGRPCLWTDPKPNGPTGFVRNPYGGVDVAAGRYANTAFSPFLWPHLVLDRDWAFITED